VIRNSCVGGVADMTTTRRPHPNASSTCGPLGRALNRFQAVWLPKSHREGQAGRPLGHASSRGRKECAFFFHVAESTVQACREIKPPLLCAAAEARSSQPVRQVAVGCCVRLQAHTLLATVRSVTPAPPEHTHPHPPTCVCVCVCVRHRLCVCVCVHTHTRPRPSPPAARRFWDDASRCCPAVVTPKRATRALPASAPCRTAAADDVHQQELEELRVVHDAHDCQQGQQI
jgi:hypothetical protein